MGTSDGSSCTRHSTAIMAASGTLVAMAVTAFATYKLTKRSEDNKHKAVIYRQFQREKMLKEKTAAARKAAKDEEPESGTLLEDLKIDKVYLWECEDLRKRFPSSMTENKMKFASNPVPEVRSPILRLSNPASSYGAAAIFHHKNYTECPYNKLISDHECILGQIIRKPNMPTYTVSYMRAGPRQTLHFDPETVSAAIVTCGGLCPGLNNVIREITNTLHQLYGIGGTVYGIQGGYRGFYDDGDGDHLRPIVLTPALVENIHHSGGTCLGSSRGGFDLDKILDFLHAKKINQLYVIGGDGTHRGAFRIRTYITYHHCFGWMMDA